MNTNSEVTIFAEDLVMCLCRRTEIWWKPKSWRNKRRNLSHDKFTDRIGDVVYYLLQLHWRAPEMLNAGLESWNEYLLYKFFKYGYLDEDWMKATMFNAGLESWNEYLLYKFFKYGYEAFNLLDYFAQLLSVGISCKGNYGQSDALDFCADAIAKAITHLAEDECIPLADIWNQLRQTAEKVDLPYFNREPFIIYMWAYPF